MKTYEGKKFAFIRAIYWLLTPYTKYEGKLNFKQKNIPSFHSLRDSYVHYCNAKIPKIHASPKSPKSYSLTT